MSMSEQEQRKLFEQHQLEQFAAATLQIAALVTNYYRALRNGGLPEEAAIAAMVAFQSEIFEAGRQSSQEAT